MKTYLNFITEMIEIKPSINISELKEFEFIIDIRKIQNKFQFTTISDEEKLKILSEFEKYFDDTSDILRRLNKDIKNTWGWKFKIQNLGFNKLYLDYVYYNQNIPELSNYLIPIISWKDFIKIGLKKFIDQPFIFDKNNIFAIDVRNSTKMKQIKAIKELEKIGVDYNEDSIKKQNWAWIINIRKWYKMTPIYIDFLPVNNPSLPYIYGFEIVTLDEFLEVGLDGIKELIEMKKDAKNFNL